MASRSLEELIDDVEPAWPLILDLVRKASHEVDILSGDRQRCDETLQRVQVTTRSPMGAIIHESGGLLFDRGWVRLLGAGHPRLPRDLATWNYGPLEAPHERMPGAFLIADDVVGGFFALNGGSLPGGAGNVHYFAPDSLEWEDLGRGYTDFVNFLAVGDLDKFYESHRWPAWQTEVAAIGGGQALSVAPPLWARGAPVVERSRRPVPVEEVWALQQDIRCQNRW